MEWFVWASANLLPGDNAGWFYFWALVGSFGGAALARFNDR